MRNMRHGIHAEQIWVSCPVPLTLAEDAWQLDGALELQACGMAEPQCCLQDMPQEDKMALRMTAIDQVLGTQMTC